uniref:Sushi domain-containing protein n=1 Tax=Ficedula albicollis TaxID=59894 RepID=A0A803VE36_FICAL
MQNKYLISYFLKSRKCKACRYFLRRALIAAVLSTCQGGSILLPANSHRELTSFHPQNKCLCPTDRGVPGVWRCRRADTPCSALCRHPLRAASGHPQRAALGEAAGRVPLRHLGDLHLQPRARPARGALHPLHHPRRLQRVEYECQPGYTPLLGVSPAITCLSNQTWSAAPQFCKRKQCPNPANPANGRAAVLTDLLFGSKINYTCDKGYKLVGGSHRICEVSGTGVSWSGDPPVCHFFLENLGHCVAAEVVSCPSVPSLGSADRALVLPSGITCAAPPAIAQGTHSGGSRDSFSFGDVVTYTCASGLAPAGNTSLSCTSLDGEHGTWSGAVPRCQGTARAVPTASSGCPWHKGCGAAHIPLILFIYLKVDCWRFSCPAPVSHVPLLSRQR